MTGRGGPWYAPSPPTTSWYSNVAPPTFSSTEIRDLVIACLVLTFDFVIILGGGGLLSGGLLNLPGGLALERIVAIAALTALTGFAGHEMAHKFSAQDRGMWAEFRMSVMGLITSILFSFIGFLWAAPGATYVGGMGTREDQGVTSLAGPGWNLIMASVFAVGGFLDPSHVLGTIFLYVALLNVYLAGFNLLPFWVLDGRKVFRWNKAVWTGAFVLAVVFGLWLYLNPYRPV
jgi:Zn-dependent protease